MGRGKRCRRCPIPLLAPCICNTIQRRTSKQGLGVPSSQFVLPFPFSSVHFPHPHQTPSAPPFWLQRSRRRGVDAGPPPPLASEFSLASRSHNPTLSKPARTVAEKVKCPLEPPTKTRIAHFHPGLAGIHAQPKRVRSLRKRAGASLHSARAGPMRRTHSRQFASQFRPAS